MGRPNLTRETKLSGANGDRENSVFPVQLTHKQDWQPYPVDAQSAESNYHTHTHTGTVGMYTSKNDVARIHANLVEKMTLLIIP